MRSARNRRRRRKQLSGDKREFQVKPELPSGIKAETGLLYPGLEQLVEI